MNEKHAWLLLVLAFILATAPATVVAADPPGASATANQICAEWYARCQGQPCGATPPACSQPVPGGGTAGGTCVQSLCNAQTFTDAGGSMQNIGDAVNFMQQALGMLQGLLGKGGSSSSGGGSAGGAGGNYLPTMAPEPASFFGGVQATTSAKADFFDSYYQPATKASDAIQDVAAEPEPSATFLDAVAKGFSNVTDKITEVTVGIVDKPVVPPPPPPATDIQRGLPKGNTDIRKTEDGTEIEIGAEEDSTGVAGFYGAANEEGTGLSVVGRLCVARPWAGGIFAKIIPAVLFDKLCNVGGYHVGALPIERDVVNATQLVHQAAQRSALEEEPVAKKKGISCKPPVLRQGAQAAIEFSCGTGDRLLRTVGFRAGINDSRVSVYPQKDTIYSIVCSNDFEESCQVKVVNPRIILVAEPAAVRLGARAIIRWETKDVEGETCVIKGPSFSETGSYGAASTVPISGPSSYTATCTALDGEPVTENLTVDLAL